MAEVLAGLAGLVVGFMVGYTYSELEREAEEVYQRSEQWESNGGPERIKRGEK